MRTLSISKQLSATANPAAADLTTLPVQFSTVFVNISSRFFKIIINRRKRGAYLSCNSQNRHSLSREFRVRWYPKKIVQPRFKLDGKIPVRDLKDEFGVKTLSWSSCHTSMRVYSTVGRSRMFYSATLCGLLGLCCR